MAPQRHKMRIVTHNAFWFQGAPFAPEVPGPADAHVLDRLVAIYQNLAPDVLCLQEIQNEETFRLVAQALQMTGAYCPGGALPQYGGAVLGKAGRVLADSREAARQTQRLWQMVEAPRADGRALRVANVHLPSSRQLGAQAAAQCRSDEMAAVLDRRDPPEVVVGDFNEQPGGGVSEVLAARGYLDAAEIAARGELGTTASGHRPDQVWVLATMREHLVGCAAVSEAAMRTDLPGKRHLSDHFPVWIALD
jgi:endonuclease/exonuclease/phosphatase family metal-dependent hydrolase